MNKQKIMIECENLVKIYKTDETEVVALQGLDLTVKHKEIMAIIGNSGSGKSTLLNLLGGLDRPSAGRLIVDNKDLLKFNDEKLTQYNRKTIGFVWQNNARNLIPYMSAIQNVEIPMIICKKKDRRQRAKRLLEMVDLKNRMNNKLEELSGGEQQRVAIAIALANNPKILLADEPTGSLDTKTTEHIMNLLNKLNKMLDITVVIVTHDRAISKMVKRVVAIRDGITSSEFIRKNEYIKEFTEIDDKFIDHEKTHEEYIVMDKHGRLQIPKEAKAAMGITGKCNLKYEIKDDNIVIINPENKKTKKSRDN